MVDQAISQAWLEAAKDLGIGITAPFTVQSHEPSSYAAHVIDFGGPKGMVVSSRRRLYDSRDSRLLPFKSRPFLPLL